MKETPESTGLLAEVLKYALPFEEREAWFLLASSKIMLWQQ
jgi:hypothetical protein